MAPRGRPPAPLEHHRRVGRGNGTKKADGRALPAVAEVVQLPMADGVPDSPTDFGLEARRLWERVWSHGVTWVSPSTDMEAVEQACRLADDIEIARRRYRATTDPADGRMVVQMDAALSSALSTLGFNPTARSRLGIAEVTRATKLEQLRSKKPSR